MMANVWLDGFDNYAVSADLTTFEYTVPNSLPVLSTSSGRFGGGGITINGSPGSGIFKAKTFALELWLGFAVKVLDTNSRDAALCTFVSPGASASGIEGVLTYNAATGILKAWRGQMQTLLGSVAITLTNSTWYWLDVHFKYNSSTGIFEVWQSGTQVLNLTAQNTANNSGQTNLSGVVLGCQAGTVNSLNAVVDDFVVNDTTGSYNNGRVGDSRIETLKPASDATPNNGTCSTGTTHYAMLNEAQWNSTNYITMTNTSGQEELFGFTSLSSTPVSISAIKPVFIAENTDAGSGNLETVIVSSATEIDGTSTPLTSSWTRHGSTLEVDPHTSAPWTPAAVNAVQGGFKVP
jgi:hypothetical protein